ncbi:MAG: exosome complex RNA-binding protein Csl4 [Candidatus Bathyarchaeota archaeon]|nr:MAG: exosome complex RNA-binding protein Csl4 [Candidatus Bathyarchaeota archaeon]UCE57742.1 MAG: exosome complex RNA-binding protein Csl4 [Candidatus Bathyarchaeota archaeon]
MNRSERKSGIFVAPGDLLGVIEEFTPGPGTYVEHGTIHSKITGRTLLDMLNKKVSVYPLVRVASVPQIGSMVSGQVLDMKGKKAVLRITQIGQRSLSGFFTGILHISEASAGYVDTMSSVCKTGDIMRAKVISDKNRTFYLSTTEKDLGVIHALCSRCGHSLQQGKRGMQCSRCGNIERRKVSADYGKGAAYEEEK